MQELTNYHGDCEDTLFFLFQSSFLGDSSSTFSGVTGAKGSGSSSAEGASTSGGGSLTLKAVLRMEDREVRSAVLSSSMEVTSGSRTYSTSGLFFGLARGAAASLRRKDSV